MESVASNVFRPVDILLKALFSQPKDLVSIFMNWCISTSLNYMHDMYVIMYYYMYVLLYVWLYVCYKFKNFIK